MAALNASGKFVVSTTSMSRARTPVASAEASSTG